MNELFDSIIGGFRIYNANVRDQEYRVRTFLLPQGIESRSSRPWSEIFDVWRDGEAGQESWKKHWEERGFDSWDEWRNAYIAPYCPEKLHWSLYRITDPTQAVSEFFGVPADAWIRNAYGDETTKRICDILDLPIVTENPKIRAIQNDFPQETMLTGVIHNGRIVLLEGMHRACALATWNPNTPFTADVSIALAEWENPELPRIGGNYKNA